MRSFRAPSASEFTSPARSITGTPSRSRTAASQLTRLHLGLPPGAATSSTVRPPPSLVTRASSTIFSIRNSPQPRGFWRPSSFASRSGASGSASSPASPWSRDLHAQAIGGAEHANRDRPVGPVLVAVLHRVHRGLGHSRLQPLEARGREAEVRRPRERPAPSPRARCRARSEGRSRRAPSRSRPATRRAHPRSAGA